VTDMCVTGMGRDVHVVNNVSLQADSKAEAGSTATLPKARITKCANNSALSRLRFYFHWCVRPETLVTVTLPPHVSLVRAFREMVLACRCGYARPMQRSHASMVPPWDRGACMRMRC
jgi:hypothetical protein